MRRVGRPTKRKKKELPRVLWIDDALTSKGYLRAWCKSFTQKHASYQILVNPATLSVDCTCPGCHWTKIKLRAAARKANTNPEKITLATPDHFCSHITAFAHALAEEAAPHFQRIHNLQRSA